MSTAAQVIRVQPGEGRAFSAVGDVYRILATGEQTGVAYCLCEARVLPGGGPPPHIHHREDESFFVLEGEITFQLAGERVVAKAGSFIQGPRCIPHAFKNESNAPARMLIHVSPPGFEKFLADFATPVPSFDSPPRRSHRRTLRSSSPSRLATASKSYQPHISLQESLLDTECDEHGSYA